MLSEKHKEVLLNAFNGVLLDGNFTEEEQIEMIVSFLNDIPDSIKTGTFTKVSHFYRMGDKVMRFGNQYKDLLNAEYIYLGRRFYEKGESQDFTGIRDRISYLRGRVEMLSDIRNA